jgi:hypothetical protein
MDIEYHFYITYIVALRAGFDRVTAYKIAYSSQYTDDNDRENLIINEGRSDEYEVYISQTMNIFKPGEERLRIYPIFHFFPGTPEETLKLSARRCDGKLHLLNTTPCNSNALKLINDALKTNNPYRIGISTHTFVDTFAHQNFVGFKEDFNGMKGILRKLIPDIGHADAKYNPDWPALKWQDDRLISKCRDIDNKRRFLEASEKLFELYCLHLKPDTTRQKLARDKKALLDELDRAIGEYDKKNKKKDRRINRYKDLIGDNLIEDYDKKSWFKVAVKRQRKDSGFDGGFGTKTEWDYLWKENYVKSDWYKFQQAVKAHQRKAKEILKPLFEQMEVTKLDNW